MAATNSHKIIEEIQNRLCSLPGIVAVRLLDKDALKAVLDIEVHCERSALIPLVNQGMRCLLERQVALALLKDYRFRGSPAPTVYLVEDVPDGDEIAEAHCLSRDGKRYRIVGEEISKHHRTYTEKTITVSDSFVLFPNRRARPDVSCYFLMPALTFPELEEKKEGLGIERVVSISPSAAADSHLREICGFPTDPKLATLLLGFNPVRESQVGISPIW